MRAQWQLAPIFLPYYMFRTYHHVFQLILLGFITCFIESTSCSQPNVEALHASSQGMWYPRILAAKHFTKTVSNVYSRYIMNA